MSTEGQGVEGRIGVEDEALFVWVGEEEEGGRMVKFCEVETSMVKGFSVAGTDSVLESVITGKFLQGFLGKPSEEAVGCCLARTAVEEGSQDAIRFCALEPVGEEERGGKFTGERGNCFLRKISGFTGGWPILSHCDKLESESHFYMLKI